MEPRGTEPSQSPAGPLEPIILAAIAMVVGICAVLAFVIAAS